VVVVNIQKNDIPIGDITLLFSTNNSLHNQDIIELFANQIGLLLDRNRSEISLSNSEEKFRTLIEQSPIAIEFYDSTGMLAEVNLACLKLFGIINKKQIEKFALFDDPNISDDHKKSLKHFKPIRYEAIFDFDIVIKNKLYSTTKSGKIWIDTIITPINSLDEQQSGYLLQIQDITNRKQLEQDLLNSSNRLILATNAAGIGIWDFDVVNNKLVWDEQMYKLYGLTKTQFSGAYESWRAGLHPDDMKRGDDEIQMALRGKKEFNTEFRVLWPDKTIRYIRAIAIVNRDPYGKALRMIGTNWDITKQKQLSEDLINKVNEYAKLNSIMTGRELKMIELKEEIARLKK